MIAMIDPAISCKGTSMNSLRSENDIDDYGDIAPEGFCLKRRFRDR